MIKLALGLVALAAVLVAVPARADDGCPADKPHAKRAVDLSYAQQCQANIVTALRCPRDDAKPCYYIARQKCDEPKTTTLCLSDDELRESRERE